LLRLLRRENTSGNLRLKRDERKIQPGTGNFTWF